MKKRAKKPDPNQLNLKLIFNDPPPIVHALIEALTPYSTPPKRRGGLRTPKQEKPTERATCNRLALILALQWTRPVEEIWILAYHRFFKATGVHPVVVSTTLGLPTHLDAVEKVMLLPALVTVMQEMLTTDAIP